MIQCITIFFRKQEFYNAAENSEERKNLLDKLFKFQYPRFDCGVTCHFSSFRFDLGLWTTVNIVQKVMPLILAKYFHLMGVSLICSHDTKKEIQASLRQGLQKSWPSVNPKKPDYYGDMTEMKMSSWKLTRLYQKLMIETVKILLEYEVITKVLMR